MKIQTLLIIVVLLIGAWRCKSALDHYYQNHISAVNVETGERMNVIIKEN